MTGVGAEAALVGLGAVHGLNPGMGWLFAVALGLQERSRRALWRALPPLALGHAGAIALAVAVAAGLGHAFPARELRWAVAVALVGLGVLRLVRHGHPRGGFRVGGRDLALWSLLMATAHGAGLMVLPLVLPSSGRRPVTRPTQASCWPVWAPGSRRAARPPCCTRPATWA